MSYGNSFNNTKQTTDIKLRDMDSEYESLSKSVSTLQNHNGQLTKALRVVGTAKDTNEFRAKVHSNIQVTRALVNDISRRFNDLGEDAGVKYRKLNRHFEERQDNYCVIEDDFNTKFQRIKPQASKRKSELATPLLENSQTDPYNNTNNQQQNLLTQMEIKEYDVEQYQRN
eukprot:UN30748